MSALLVNQLLRKLSLSLLLPLFSASPQMKKKVKQTNKTLLHSLTLPENPSEYNFKGHNAIIGLNCAALAKFVF